MSGWTVTIPDAKHPASCLVLHMTALRFFVQVIDENSETCVCLTPAQSATLRAALEAAEQEMS